MDTSEYVPAKYCSKCGELKPLTEYYLKSGSDQHRAQCKKCSCNEQKHYNYENRDHIREYKWRIESNSSNINVSIFKILRNVSMITDAIDITRMMHIESHAYFVVDYTKQ